MLRISTRPTKGHWQTALVIATCAGLSAAVYADSGGPDAFGYTYADSFEKSGPAFDFEDISGTGTEIFLGDDDLSAPLPIGFLFTFYGQQYSHVYCSSNGFLTFDPSSSDGCCAGQPLPTGPGFQKSMIAGWWADFDPGTEGTIHYQTQGPVGDRVFILQVDDITHCCEIDNGTSTYQYKLFEADNSIEMHYVTALLDDLGGGLGACCVKGECFDDVTEVECFTKFGGEDWIEGVPCKKDPCFSKADGLGATFHTAGIQNHYADDGLEYHNAPVELSTPLAVRYSAPKSKQSGVIYIVEYLVGQRLMILNPESLITATVASGMPPDTLGIEFLDGTTIIGLTETDVYTVDIETGTVTILGAHGVPDALFAGDLTWGSDGQLYGTARKNFFTVDTVTGVATIITSSNGLDIMGGLHTSDGVMYVTESDGGDDALYTINPATGAVTLVADFPGVQYGAQGIDETPDGTVYMLDDDTVAPFLYTIDLTTGVLTTVGNHGGLRAEALAILSEEEKKDECEADIDGSGSVGTPDLLAILGAWGPCPGGCDEDIAGDDEIVGVGDLLALLANWGECD